MTNFILVIAIARSEDAASVGRWTLAFAVITFVATLSRAALSTPVILARGTDLRRDVRGGLGLAASAGVAAGLLAFALSLVGAIDFAVAAAMALAAPAAIAQDFLRYAWISRGEPRLTFVLDVIWLLVQGTATIAVIATGHSSTVVLTLAWGGGAAVAVVFGCTIDVHARTSISASRAFIAAHSKAARSLLSEASANALAANVLPFTVSLSVGLGAAGAFRVAQTIFAPLTTLIAGVNPVLLRMLSGKMDAGQSTTRLRWLVATALSVTTALFSVGVLLIPDAAGQLLAGELWSDVSLVLVPLTILSLLRPFLSITMTHLRAQRRFKLLRNSSWMFLIPTMLWPICGGWLFGIVGVGWGQVVDLVIRATYYSSRSRASKPKS